MRNERNFGKALTPVDQRTVFFYDDELTAVRVKDGTIYIPIRPICDNPGIALAGQRERINRDPVLSEAVTSVGVTLAQRPVHLLVNRPLLDKKWCCG